MKPKKQTNNDNAKDQLGDDQIVVAGKKQYY